MCLCACFEQILEKANDGIVRFLDDPGGLLGYYWQLNFCKFQVPSTATTVELFTMDRKNHRCCLAWD